MRLIYTTIEKIKTARDGKGKSIIDFPDDYVVIDIETTGLSPTYDEIIEISALKYHSNVLIDKFVTLVRPYNLIDEYLSLIHISVPTIHNIAWQSISSFFPDFIVCTTRWTGAFI